MKKITLTFEQLFDLYSTGIENNKIHNTNKKIYTKSPSGTLVEIKGLIRKTNNTMVKASFTNGIKHKMSNKHLLKTTNGFKFVKNLNKDDKICVYKESPTKLKNIKEYKSNGIAYDICLDHPHEYITPNKLIHHNTTSARIIVDQLIKDSDDVLLLNGSSTTGVNTFRDTIEPYLKSPAFSSNHKIVYIDEFDYMTSNAQADMRHIMEKYAEVGRFICTANYKSKIIDPLHSRFQTFEMKTISNEFALKYCENILKGENVEYDIDTIKLVIKSLSPDIRKIVNTLQRNVIDGKLEGVSKDQITSIENKIIALFIQICDSIGKPNLKNTLNIKIPEIQNVFSTDGEPDYHSVYLQLFNSSIPSWAKIVVNKYNNDHQSCAVPQMHFMACVWETIQTGMQYYKTFNVKRK